MNPSHKEVEWNLDLRRILGIDEVAEWNELQEELELIVFSEEDDTVIWALEPSGKFSTKSLYRFMTHSGNVDLIENDRTVESKFTPQDQDLSLLIFLKLCCWKC